MDSKSIVGIVALLSFVSILFTPSDSKVWVYFLMIGVIFGIWWFKS